MRVGWLMLVSIAAFAASPARGQAPMPDPYEPTAGVTPGHITWNFGGSVLVPVSSSSDVSDVGGGLAVGLTFNAHKKAGIQLEYGANWSSLKNNSPRLNAAGIQGHGFLQYFNANVVVHPGHADRVGFYLIGGGGLYYRNIDVTRIEGTAVVPYCDPFLYYCSATPVSVQSVLGSRSSWDWGVDGGAGLTFAVSPPLRLYVEARYHYIWGPTFTGANGQRQTANGQYIPVTFGIQF
jgi:hypothetical protein